MGCFRENFVDTLYWQNEKKPGFDMIEKNCIKTVINNVIR